MNPLHLHKLRVFANRFSQKSLNWTTISSNSNPLIPIPFPILISRRTLTTRIQSLNSPNLGLLSTPWAATQIRPKYCGSDVRPGNVIERKGRIYQVVKALHRTPGKGGALIQVELRDVDSGNKVNERLRTDEAIERVFVEQKTFTYLYTDEETDCVVLMDPKTFVQVDVPKTLFGESFLYLKDDMTVTVGLYDDKPMSASIPTRVTCTIAETQAPVKNIGATPHTKKALLDNGLTVQVPAYLLTGEQILISTTDNSYMSRA